MGFIEKSDLILNISINQMWFSQWRAVLWVTGSLVQVYRPFRVAI